MQHTKIQVYCRRPSMGETLALLDMSVDFIAWHVHPENGDALIHSRLIAGVIRDAGATSVLLVHSRKLHVLSAVAEMISPDYLLMSSDRNDQDMPQLSSLLGSKTRLMMSVPVRPMGSAMSIDSLAIASTYANYAGMLILDTCPDPKNLERFGCTGRTNDWGICAEIVKASSCPVILAGGLDVANVASGIDVVAPFGVDACTSLELADKSKNLVTCKEFVDAVKVIKE